MIQHMSSERKPDEGGEGGGEGGGDLQGSDEKETAFLQRYSRHLMLSEIGEEGQAILSRSVVGVFGAGGLGSAALYYLAASGVGTLRVVDYDRVSLDNLQRQILYTTADIGRPKARSAQESLALLNPEIEIVPLNIRLVASNADALLAPCCVALDCGDNFTMRDTLNSACWRQGKVMVSAAAVGFTGSLIRLHPKLESGSEGGVCYRCLFPDEPDFSSVPRCDSVGIFAPVAGVMGVLQAAEALRFLLGKSSRLERHLLWYEGLLGQFHEFEVARNPRCPTCSPKSAQE